MTIKVLATQGCASCNAFFENVRQAAEEMELDATIVKIDDLMGILSYKILSMPALIVDEKVVVYGKKLSVKEIKDLLSI